MKRALFLCVILAWIGVTAGCGSDSTGREEAFSDVDAELDLDATDTGANPQDLDLEEDDLDIEEDDIDTSDVGATDVDDVEWDQTDEDTAAEDLVDDDASADTGSPGDVGHDMAMPEAPQPFTIRFATYNVRTSTLNNSAWGDTHVGWDSNDAARMRRIADTIAGQNLTVVAAQEIQKSERGAILTRLANVHDQTWGHSTYKNGRGESVVLFDKAVWKFVRETHYLIPVRGNRERYAVGALLEHKATGRRVWFYSVHLSAGGGDGATPRRIGTERTLASIENHPVAQGLPFVLGGDFNSSRHDVPANMLRNSGLMKSTRAVADQLVNNGCNTFNSSAGSGGEQSCPGGVARHIDQVWVSKSGMKVRKYRVTANAQTSRSSDHNPVTTILDKL